MKIRKLAWWLWVLIIGVVGFGLIQLVPYGKNVTNPPVVNEPKWDSAATAVLVKASCYDCHSNETHHPWYSKVAPASWLLQRDVDEGRDFLNFSEWPTDPNVQKVKLAQITSALTEGEMPPIQYTLIHPGSKLTAEQVGQVLSSLQAGIQ